MQEAISKSVPVTIKTLPSISQLPLSIEKFSTNTPSPTVKCCDEYQHCVAHCEGGFSLGTFCVELLLYTSSELYGTRFLGRKFCSMQI